MAAFQEEIVFAPSEDQRWLAGVLVRPNAQSRRSVGIICLHGANLFFYLPTYVALGRALAEQGYLYLSGNTRSARYWEHGFSLALQYASRNCTSGSAGRRGLVPFEEVAHDVAGWIDYMVAQGAEHIVLFGHSFGVLLATYYQATRQDPRVVGLILSSGIDVVEAQDPARVQQAEDLVAAGKGTALVPLPEGVPVFALESADWIVDWERLTSSSAAQGHTRWIASIHIPILATFGTEDFNPNQRGSLEEMRARATQAPRFDLQAIEGADHGYTDREQVLAKVILDWLDQLPAAQKVTRRS